MGCETLQSVTSSVRRRPVAERHPPGVALARLSEGRVEHPQALALTQTTVALSSADAELGGICKGVSLSLGLQAQIKGFLDFL